MKTTLISILAAIVLPLAVWAQTRMNNGTTSFNLVPTNGATVFTGNGEVYLELYNAGSNTVIWAFGSSVGTTNLISSNLTNTVYIGQSLPAGTSKSFDKQQWNTSDSITAITTNSGNGWLNIHKGY